MTMSAGGSCGQTVADNAPPAANVRHYTDGSAAGRRQPLWGQLVAITTLALYVGWLTHVLLALVIAAFWSRLALTLLVMIYVTLLLPAKPLLWNKFNRCWVFRHWREYFNFSCLHEEHLQADKRYILVEFPHGAFPIAAITAGTLMQELYPQMKFFSIAASSAFMVPGWKHFLTWLGSRPATAANMRRLLKRGSLAVILGGIAEMYMLDSKAERVKLHGRKGYARIAIEERVDGIVPVYYFGQSQLLDFGPAWLEHVARKYRCAVGVLHGRWGLPLPRNIPIYMVSGKPVPVPQTDAAPGSAEFEAAATALADAVSLALQQLYDRHKGEYGWANRPLIIQ